MLPRHIAREYQDQSFGNLEHAGLLALDSIAGLSKLGCQAFRSQLDTAQRWAGAVLDGGKLPPLPEIGDVPHEAIRLVTKSQIELLQLVESQRRLSGHTLRSALEDLQKWTPRVAQVTVSALELAVDAVELPAEAVADTVVRAVQVAEEGGDAGETRRA